MLFCRTVHRHKGQNALVSVVWPIWCPLSCALRYVTSPKLLLHVIYVVVIGNGER